MRSELKPRLQRKNRLHKGCKLFVLALLLGNIGFAYAESDASTMKLVEESTKIVFPLWKVTLST